MVSSTRRAFLKSIAAGSAAAALAPRLVAAGEPSAPRRFEVNANLYAWDLHDEGVDRILDNLQEMAAINSVYLVGLMHPERRPLFEGDFPHNPLRKVWQVEDARCYWHPEAKRYGRVKPRLSDHAWLNETDWLRVLTDAARKRGLRVGVELSHALIDAERMRGEFSDLAQRNFHGEITAEGQIKWLRPPCPNHPDTLALVRGLVADVATNHGVDYVSSCIMCFDAASLSKAAPIAGCFCAHCQKAAGAENLDLERVRRALLENPTAQPALGEWVGFRERTVARFYQRLREALHGINPRSELRYNLHSPASYRSYGANPAVMWPHLDSMRLTNYLGQEGNPALLAEKKQWLLGFKKMVGPDFPLHAAVSMRLKAAPDIIRAGVRNVVETGMAGMTASHYDAAQFSVIRSVRPALVAAGISV